jgi:hypothetical protein
MSIIKLAEFLKNVSQASRIYGASHYFFHGIKNEHRIEGF